MTTSVQPGHRRSRVPGKVDAKALGADPFGVGQPLQWYDASRLAGFSDGDRVTAWPDLSGNGFDLTAESIGPVYKVSAGIGGLPSLLFAGAGGEPLKYPARVVPLTELTLFLVSSYAGGRPIGVENDGSGAAGLGFFSNSLWVIRGTGGGDLGVASESPSVKSLALGTGGVRGLVGSGAWTGASTGYSDAGVSFHLGSSGNNSSLLSGYISEFVSWNRKLTSTEQDDVHNILRAKYGV